jgi:hypothetical protein
MALQIPGAVKAQTPTTRIWKRVLRKKMGRPPQSKATKIGSFFATRGGELSPTLSSSFPIANSSLPVDDDMAAEG